MNQFTDISEPHIVIDFDRNITVPSSLQRIAVQYDHNVETVTFDCPRKWDDHDFMDQSKYAIYVNLVAPDGSLYSDPVTNVVADSDPSIMHFDWTVKNYVTQTPGKIHFLICIKHLNAAGYEENHWNSELCRDLYVSEGLECSETEQDLTPDLVTKVLLSLDRFEQGDYAHIVERIETLEATCDAQASAIELNSAAIATEIEIRSTEDTKLRQGITQEASARSLADEALNRRIDNAQDEAVADIEGAIDALEVGGRNYLIGSDGPFTSSDTNQYGAQGLAVSTYKHGIKLEADRKYTLSFDYQIAWGECAPVVPAVGIGLGTVAGEYSHDISHAISYADKDYGTVTETTEDGVPVAGKIHITFTTPDEEQMADTPYFAMRPYRCGVETELNGSTITISNLKLEKGTFATDWTPNPAEFTPTVREIAGYRHEYLLTTGSIYNNAKYVKGFAVRYGDGSFRIYGTLSVLYGYYPQTTISNNYIDYLLRRDEISSMVFGNTGAQLKNIRGFWQGIFDISHGDGGQFEYTQGKEYLANDKVLKFIQGGPADGILNVHKIAKNFSLYFDIYGEADV